MRDDDDGLFRAEEATEVQGLLEIKDTQRP